MIALETIEELVNVCKGRVRNLTNGLRAVFVVGQGMKPAERLAKADGLIATAKLVLGLLLELRALEFALERAEAARAKFASLTEGRQHA